MKYIIEIEDAPFESEGSEMELYKATEFNSLVFDKIGLEKLIPYNESEAEQRGADKAWEFFKKLDAMSSEEWMECFEQTYIPGCFEGMSYTEAKAKYDAWQKRKDELKIGDEVMHDAYRRCVLLEKKDIHEVELWSVIDEKGTVHQINGKHISRKTGRHFPQVAELLEKMKESK